MRRDRPVEIDADGTAHCLTDEGQAIGFRLYHKKSVVSAPDPVNSPGRVNRLNQHRKWRPMQLQGWPRSIWGLGRHRIASSIFMYLPCPAGGHRRARRSRQL
jgi:hypothetical protein